MQLVKSKLATLLFNNFCLIGVIIAIRGGGEEGDKGEVYSVPIILGKSV